MNCPLFSMKSRQSKRHPNPSKCGAVSALIVERDPAEESGEVLMSNVAPAASIYSATEKCIPNEIRSWPVSLRFNYEENT
jgi:hypothetical protein